MTKRKQQPINWGNLVIKLVIIPLIIVSDVVFFRARLYFGSGCTGTSSAWYNTHAICQEAGEFYWVFDVFCFSLILLIIWLILAHKWYGHLTRLFILFYLFGGRIVILYLLSVWQVIPFAP